MNECFAVTSGSYSDYTVHCVFEREEDAQAYALLLAKNDLKAVHDNMARRGDVRGIGRVCSGKAEDCDLHGPMLSRLETDNPWHLMDVERFQFFPAGVVPAKELEQE